MPEARPLKKKLWITAAVLQLGAVAAVACSSGTPASPGMPDASASSTTPVSVTYYANVKPIFDAKCTMCHKTGGIAPFTLLSYSDATAHADEIAPQVQSKTMPPWPPGAGCNAYLGDRSLTSDQIETITSWVSGGQLEGDPSTYAPLPGPPPLTMSRVDDSLQMPETYTPQQTPDDYRCFLLAWPETSLKYVTGFSATPGQPTIVHHLLSYIVPPAQIPTFQAYDANDPGPGYTCFGGPTGSLNSNGTSSVGADAGSSAGSGMSALAGLPQQVGGWVPGSLGSDFPAGTGIKIQPGSMIVLQVHYNTLSAPPVPDQTSLQFEVADSVTKEAYVVPFTDPSWPQSHTMDIPAGDPDVEHSYAIGAGLFASVVTNGAVGGSAPFTMYSSLLHMHLHGTQTSLTLEHSDGTSSCLLDIPDWNFHWQGTYWLQQPVVVQPSDQLSIDCHWDNSTANQPVINRAPIPTADINWGEGTTDEMCIGFVYVTQ